NEGIESEVKLWGFSKNTEEFYQNNDVFIMGSVSEAFGRVTVEAMMNGMLVIGRNAGGTPEILDDGKFGLLFQTSDELANKLEYVLKNKQEH
ncbi:glycosyltransferase, partial [Streptomyces brasiliscabiei]|uniref:glycosyltransferase n=1 Tax=Streptomyces brasiliscabiei TaxID=2736302 RepID=UPI0038F6399F